MSTQPALSSASKRLATVQAVRDASHECQSENNPAWVDLANLLMPYTYDTEVQEAALKHLSGVLKNDVFWDPLWADVHRAASLYHNRRVHACKQNAHHSTQADR
jgi:hypothetical protein